MLNKFYIFKHNLLLMLIILMKIVVKLNYGIGIISNKVIGNVNVLKDYNKVQFKY